jgi:predicted transcriptional regulator
MAVSEGNLGPTRIMYKANLTWPLTIAYLEILTRHQMVVRQANGGSVEYAITQKGTSLLRTYTQLQEAASGLELERASYNRIEKVLESQGAPVSGGASSLASVRKKLESLGLEFLEGTVEGTSGSKHKFDLMVKTAEGMILGFYVVPELTEVEVVKYFIIQLDSGISTVVVYGNSPPGEVLFLGQSYSLKMVMMGDFLKSGLEAVGS